jgi:hypothetical protein
MMNLNHHAFVYDRRLLAAAAMQQQQHAQQQQQHQHQHAQQQQQQQHAVHAQQQQHVQQQQQQQRGPVPKKDAEEVASFLLQLKHRSVTPEPHRDEAELRAFQLAASQGRQLQGYSYPAVGAVYGLPALNPYTVERPPALLEEPMAELPWEMLLAESKLVMMKDRDLVPDALFVAMAQMKICKLTQADRVGCYKTREIGFLGMCCKHCAGQPGFGRYYPNSVRSLAQTTTSQTILKHIGSKCRFCPAHIRQAVLELQRQQAAKEGIAAGRPRYGSRKIFFQRIWARLHGKRERDADEEAKDAGDSGSDVEEENEEVPSDSETDEVGKQKRDDTQKVKRSDDGEDRSAKRSKIESV